MLNKQVNTSITAVVVYALLQKGDPPFFCVACNVMYKDMYVHHIEYKICCCVFLNHSIHSYE